MAKHSAKFATRKFLLSANLLYLINDVQKASFNIFFIKLGFRKKKRPGRKMAVPPPPPTVDAAIVSSVDRLQKVLMLPGNWRHSFSLRLSADSASILVSWSSPAAPVKPRSGGADEGKKKKKKSPSSLRKSNERAAAHRVRVLDRQCVISPQHPHLNPHLPPFVPNSVSSLIPAAESVKDSGAVPSQTGTVLLEPLPEDPGPGPSEERRVEKRVEKRQKAEVDQLTQV